MQLGYEHCLPKKTKNLSHRFAIVFRNGEEGYVRLVTQPKYFASETRTLSL
jgi:hypothetical protein